MLNAREVFARVHKLDAFRAMKESDFREVDYVQEFTPAAGGVPTVNVPQPFPGGAIILGITAAAVVPGIAAPAGGLNRQFFKIDFGFSGGEAIVIGGPVLADALLGGGEQNIFPLKELVMAPNQAINCRVANMTAGLLTVNVVYHCLVYRFAS